MSDGLRIGEFVHTFGDVHLYSNHREQVAEQLQRTPKPLPSLTITPRTWTVSLEEKVDPRQALERLLSIEYEDIALVGYHHHPAIKAPVAV